MTRVKPASQWVHRSTLNDSEKLGVRASQTSLAAFTPDIVPLDQINATPAEVAASYKHFISHAIDRDEASTLIYIRAKTTSPISSRPPEVYLYAMENHLVLWPDTVLQQAQYIGSTTLEMTPSQTRQDIAVGGPITYKPINLSGTDRHETLIAVQEQFEPKFQALSRNVRNWRDLAQHVGQSTNMAFYNAMLADPCASHVKLTTKLDLPEEEKFYIGLEAVGIPTQNIEASLSISNASSTLLSIERQPLIVSKEFGNHFFVPFRFSGEVTLQIFNDKGEVFRDYSSVSITLFEASSETLLGAEHVVFDSNPRVKRLVRKFNPHALRQATTVKAEATSTTIKAEATSTTIKAEATSTTTSTDETRFYFRAETGETESTSKNGNGYYSPDIQPMGDTAITDPKTTLSGETVDVSSQDRIGLTWNTSNYIYLRAHTTVAHKGQVRLFFMPNTVLLHPVDWNKAEYTTFDFDPKTQTSSTALRDYNTEGLTGTQQVIFEEPFVLANLAEPPEGHDHYCFIAECKPHRTKAEVQNNHAAYKWPHDDVDEIKTSADFAVWMANNRRVVQRNVSVTCDNDGATYNKRQAFTLPKGSTTSETWHYNVHVKNCPVGSEFSMDSTSSKISYARTKVTTSNQGGYAEFTGEEAGFSAQVVLHWYANGYSVQTGQVLSGELSIYKQQTSNAAKSSVRTSGTAAVKQNSRLHVGEGYPVLIVSSKARVAGRLKLGGAIKARKATKPVRKANVPALKAATSGSSSDDSGDDSDSGDSSGSEGVWEELEVGSDAVNLA